MGGEEESARTGDSNPGCNYLARGYSPSMQFFWGGDMPHYSPPLPFRRGRAWCPCVLVSPRGHPARWSRTCALAGVPRPAPRIVATYMRDGRRARPHVWSGVHGLARWLARPGPHPGSRPRTCMLAGLPRPAPRVQARKHPRLSTRPRTHLPATAPRFSPVCAPLLAEFFSFLTDISV